MTDYDPAYVEECKDVLRTTPPSVIWEMEHGSEIDRLAISNIKRAAGVE
ncbi:hypothetical protein [Methanolobus sp. WCC5]